MPVHDDRRLFEMLILEGAQAGLSWITILRKRPAYRKAFDRFDARKIARYGPAKKRALLRDAGIVRNRLKINAAVDERAGVSGCEERVRQLRRLHLAVRRRPAQSEPAALDEAGPGAHGRVGRHEPRPQVSRLHLRRLDDLLRVHAGVRPRQRPRRRMRPRAKDETVMGTIDAVSVCLAAARWLTYLGTLGVIGSIGARLVVTGGRFLAADARDAIVTSRLTRAGAVSAFGLGLAVILMLAAQTYAWFGADGLGLERATTIVADSTWGQSWLRTARTTGAIIAALVPGDVLADGARPRRRRGGHRVRVRAAAPRARWHPRHIDLLGARHAPAGLGTLDRHAGHARLGDVAGVAGRRVHGDPARTARVILTPGVRRRGDDGRQRRAADLRTHAPARHAVDDGIRPHADVEGRGRCPRRGVRVDELPPAPPSRWSRPRTAGSSGAAR